MNIIRSRADFWKNGGPSKVLAFATVGAVAVGWLITYSILGPALSFTKFSIYPIGLILLIVVSYLLAVEIAKKYFYERYGYLIEK